jgi:carboxyl-terminal processing protease
MTEWTFPREISMKRPRRVASIVALTLGAGACAAGARARSAPVTGGPSATETNITWLTTEILGRSQFTHHPLDDDAAKKFLAGYLDALDPSRSLFLRSDELAFQPYLRTLAAATRDKGDTGAAHAIYRRYVERLEQRNRYVSRLLRDEKFEFRGHDSYSFDREQAARPADETAAEALWRQQLRAAYLDEKLDGAEPARIVRTLTDRYVAQLETAKTLRDDELLEVYLNALAHVYDPHSDYLGHEELESFSIAMNLSLFGVGASLASVDGHCKIVELVPGGPAARDGRLKADDRIVAVAQADKPPVEIGAMPVSRIVELIRGPKGSKVTLTVLPKGDESAVPEQVALVRDEVNLVDEQASARVLDVPSAKGRPLRLGVLEIPSFYADMGEQEGSVRSVTADVRKLLGKLKAEHVRGIVLDLRKNGGGSLKEAVSLTGLFIGQGPVVQTRGPKGDMDVEMDPDPTELYAGPLLVLTSRMSASASEILTGALQDYGRALVVGDSATFGKGTVQSILPLTPIMDSDGLAHAYDPGALKVTVRKFYRPNGASTQLRGVASDLVVPSESDLREVSEAAQKDPLPWDSVASLPHERLNQVTPYVDVLRAESQRRIASEPGFALLEQDAAALKSRLAKRSVSLNEAERRQELAAAKERRAARELESERTEVAAPVAYDITLKNAAAPGLPLPAASTDHARATSVEPLTAGLDDAKQDSKQQRPISDLVLDESVQILRDYVTLLAPASG